MIVLVKLLLSHLAADFILQPDRWVKDKEEKRHRSAILYVHAFIHGALAWALVWKPDFWISAIIIAVTHCGIDLAKTRFQTSANRIAWFIADQAMHLLVLSLVWFAWITPEINIDNLLLERALIIFTAALFLTTPSSVIIRTVISQWTPETFYNISTSLPDAGKFIGFLERLFVLAFILLNHWEAVGFLLAAKSVFRFGNLKDSHDRKLTEYVLIGTLVSFGIALAVSLLTLGVLILHAR